MKINEVERQLGITKDNIRFYEREGLLAPKRLPNGYRDYDEENLETLRAILILRRLGVPVADIKDVLEHSVSLDAAMTKNIEELETKMKEMNGALLLSRRLLDRHAEVEDLKDEKLLAEMEGMEKEGFSFMGIVKDTLEYGTDALVETFTYGRPFVISPLGGIISSDFRHRPSGSVLTAIIRMLIWCVIGGASLSVLPFYSAMTFLKGFGISFVSALVFLVIAAAGRKLADLYPKKKGMILAARTVLAFVSLVACMTVLSARVTFRKPENIVFPTAADTAQIVWRSSTSSVSAGSIHDRKKITLILDLLAQCPSTGVESNNTMISVSAPDEYVVLEAWDNKEATLGRFFIFTLDDVTYVEFAGRMIYQCTDDLKQELGEILDAMAGDMTSSCRIQVL